MSLPADKEADAAARRYNDAGSKQQLGAQAVLGQLPHGQGERGAEPPGLFPGTQKDQGRTGRGPPVNAVEAGWIGAHLAISQIDKTGKRTVVGRHCIPFWFPCITKAKYRLVPRRVSYHDAWLSSTTCW